MISLSISTKQGSRFWIDFDNLLLFVKKINRHMYTMLYGYRTIAKVNGNTTVFSEKILSYKVIPENEYKALLHDYLRFFKKSKIFLDKVEL